MFHIALELLKAVWKGPAGRPWVVYRDPGTGWEPGTASAASTPWGASVELDGGPPLSGHPRWLHLDPKEP